MENKQPCPPAPSPMTTDKCEATRQGRSSIYACGCEQLAHRDPVNLAQICQFHHVDLSFSLLDLADVRFIRPELLAGCRLAQAGANPGQLEFEEELAITARMLRLFHRKFSPK